MAKAKQCLITLVYCADGNPKFAQAAVDAGWRYGARLPATVYQEVYFADQDWKKPARAAYMQALAIHRPAVATVLDWEQEDQYNEVMSWAEEASGHVREAIVIIPKIPKTVKRIPYRIGSLQVRLGYSVPTKYGGSRVNPLEFGRIETHLLGGSPHKQMELARFMNVVSVDGNMAHQQAHRCRVWCMKEQARHGLRPALGHWVQIRDLANPKGRVCADEDVYAKGGTRGSNLEAFKMSLVNIKAAWNLYFS